MDLRGATILLTGATDGIGRETAKRLAGQAQTLLVHGPQPSVDNVPVLTPARLLALLRSLPAHLEEGGVMLPAEHARHQLHPAS
jgi:NAD(P)-dependent dehydrogenase (short-subunit alcohol dehydrogenase family)